MADDFSVVPFKADHLKLLSLQERQHWLNAKPWLQEATELEYPDMAFTGVRLLPGGPQVVGAAGVIPIWEGRFVAWALLSQTGPEVFPAVHAAVKRFLGEFSVPRIETSVEAGFKNGHRWAKLLGFRLETPEPMRNYSPDGGSYCLYARCQDGRT